MGKTLGKRLRDLREHLEQRQRDVATAVGISREHLANIERGHDEPGRELLFALAEHFKRPVGWLVSEQDIPAAAEPIAVTEEELNLLEAFRKLPADEAATILRMLLSRSRELKN